MALAALIGLLPSMNPLMGKQGGPVAESFLTLSALVGLLTCMDALVLNQMKILGETLSTLITHIRF